MRTRHLALPVLLAAALAAGSPALADQDITWEFRPAAGSEPPAMIITARRTVSDLTIRLTRTKEDGEMEEVVLRPLIRRGQRNVVPLPGFDGGTAWRGTLRVLFDDGTGGEAPLELRPTTLAPLGVRADVTLEDIRARRIVLRADQPAARATVRVTGDYGRQLAATEIDLDGAPPNTPLEIAWEQQVEGEPLVIQVRVYSVQGSTWGHLWMPWQVAIPHETVVFDTGKAEIRDDQTHKLHAVLGELQTTLRRYGAAIEADRGVEVGLWVVGHTDTVGSRENNRRLSDARARAIATWFRQAGVTAPIHYRGMGQEALRVQTPNNIDEPRNRRAEYIVAAQDPYAGQSLPGQWRRLP